MIGLAALAGALVVLVALAATTPWRRRGVEPVPPRALRALEDREGDA